MWTLLLFFASTFLLAESFQDFVPIYNPRYDTTITCMIPGPFENGKRSLSAPGRVPIPEPILDIPLLPTQEPDGFWELPRIVVKEPFVPTGPPSVVQDFNLRLDRFLDPSPQMRLIANNVESALVVMDPNDVFNRSRRRYEIPDELLMNFDSAEQQIIMQYAGAIELGQCNPTYQVVGRPEFYYPRFQVQGRCPTSNNTGCSLPPTMDHAFSQRCRPDIGEVDDGQIFIRALRWDCCHSYTIEQSWEYICGWRAVRFPIVHRCQCSCDMEQ